MLKLAPELEELGNKLFTVVNEIVHFPKATTWLSVSFQNEIFKITFKHILDPMKSEPESISTFNPQDLYNAIINTIPGLAGGNGFDITIDNQGQFEISRTDAIYKLLSL